MGVTFHRAFDLTRDPLSALEDVIALGCERILTSGAQVTAIEGTGLIYKLVELAAGRIAVMAGADVNSGNIGELMALTEANEFHASAKRLHTSGMRWRPSLLKDMQGGEWQSNVEQIRSIITALKDVRRGKLTRF
jgi:copper homeostasis protein